jgi:peptide deformylase
MREGCLSFPEYLATIRRATKVTFTAYDRDESLKTYTVYGLEAIAIQHEIDHLNGVLMIDRINSLKTDWIRRQTPGESAKDATQNSPAGNMMFEESFSEESPSQNLIQIPD